MRSVCSKTLPPEHGDHSEQGLPRVTVSGCPATVVANRMCMGIAMNKADPAFFNCQHRRKSRRSLFRERT